MGTHATSPNRALRLHTHLEPASLVKSTGPLSSHCAHMHCEHKGNWEPPMLLLLLLLVVGGAAVLDLAWLPWSPPALAVCVRGLLVWVGVL